MPRVLVHGSDPPLEVALAERSELELMRAADADAEAFLSLGPAPRLQTLAEITPDEWTPALRRWAREPFWAFQRWLRAALERGQGGRWVAVTTTLGAQPFPGGGADGASAVALQTLVRVAAAEYGSQGIRANAIAAGWRVGRDSGGARRASSRVADTPSGRLTSDDDLAGAIAWLLSDDADQVNGEILRLDGGYTITAGSRPDPRTQ